MYSHVQSETIKPIQALQTKNLKEPNPTSLRTAPEASLRSLPFSPRPTTTTTITTTTTTATTTAATTTTTTTTTTTPTSSSSSSTDT
eukprot:2895292-Pyramimonas_sp.AAC.1